jgi:hypothetical protein
MFSIWEWHTREEKLKRGHIKENNFFNGTKENSISFNGTEAIISFFFASWTKPPGLHHVECGLSCIPGAGGIGLWFSISGQTT